MVRRYNHPGEHIVARYVWEGMGEKDMSEMVLSLKINKTWIGAVSVMVKGFDRYSREHERMLALLLGETGVGKEVIANAIHFSSPRAKGPLIKVNIHLA
ncbi:MAG: sigma 54-interacting transcriptional regulator [Desulfobacter sp.]